MELYAHQALAIYYRHKQESKAQKNEQAAVITQSDNLSAAFYSSSLSHRVTQREQVGEDGLAASQANSHGRENPLGAKSRPPGGKKARSL